MSLLSLVQGLTDTHTEEPSALESGWLERILPSGKLTPVEQVRHLVAASNLLHLLRSEVEVRLEQERERAQAALDRLKTPSSPGLQRAFQLAATGLNDHSEALELLALALYDGQPELLEEARQLAESADQTLDEAEISASESCEECPLVA